MNRSRHIHRLSPVAIGRVIRMVLEKRKPLIAYTLSILYLLLVAVTYNSLNPNLLRFGVWFSVVGFGAWLFYLYISNKPLRYPRLLLPIGAYLILRFIATTQAPFPIISFEVVLKELILLFGFLFVFNSLDMFWKPKTWENALINFALIFCFIELALAYFWHRNWVAVTGSLFPLPPIGYRSPGVFLGHPNILAGFLNLIAPIMVVRLIQEKTWGKRALWGFGLILVVPTLYFTSSRTGLMAGIIGVSVTLVLLYVPNLYSKVMGRGRKSLWEIVPPRVFFLALFAVVVVLGFVVFFLIQSQRISTHAPTLISARSGIWEPAIEIIRDSPILGHGPGSFSVFFAEKTQIPPGFATSHAHNILLQTAAETGILGVGFVIWISVGGIVSFIRTWKEASTVVKVRLAAYAGAGVAILSHHSLDYLFESPLYALSVFILFALALREAPNAEFRTVQRERAILIPSMILLVFLVGSTYTTVGGSDYWNGVNAGRDGDWETAAEDICRAYEVRPQITLYGFQCSLAHAQLYYRTEDPNDLQDSLRIQKETLDRDPYWPVHWANLGTLEWENGESDKAVVHMREAAIRAPLNTTFASNLAWMEEALGRNEAATDAYIQTLDADPWLQFSQQFNESEVASHVANQFDLDSTLYPARALMIEAQEALLQGEHQKAVEKFDGALEKDPQSARVYAGLAQTEQELGKSDDAWLHMQIALFIDGSSPEILFSASTLADEQGREDESQRYLKQALDQMENQTFSSSYYYRSYYRFFLSSDLMPQIMRPNFPPIVAENRGSGLDR